MKLKSVLGAF